MLRSQLRAARAMLSWSQERLAEASGVSLPTIKRLEPGEGLLSTKVETMEKLSVALRQAGIEFIAENGGGPGVRLKGAKADREPKGPAADVVKQMDAAIEKDRKGRKLKR